MREDCLHTGAKIRREPGPVSAGAWRLYNNIVTKAGRRFRISGDGEWEVEGALITLVVGFMKYKGRDDDFILAQKQRFKVLYTMKHTSASFEC